MVDSTGCIVNIDDGIKDGFFVEIFQDDHQKDFKIGDKLELTIVDAGVGEVDVVLHNPTTNPYKKPVPCIYSPSNGYLSLSEVFERKDLIIKKI